MTQISPPRRRRALGFGIASTAVAVAGLLPIAIVWVLAVSVDPLYGWLAFIVLPLAVIFGAIAVVLGVIGLVFARTDRGGYVWPIVGLILGAAPIVPAVAFLAGG